MLWGVKKRELYYLKVHFFQNNRHKQGENYLLVVRPCYVFLRIKPLSGAMKKFIKF